MIQYPKNVHVTLPSVDGFLSNLNILRDPPKSIHTRYIEKVGVTSKITEQLAAESDRFCENILPFARGVNPMVDVSYTNYGTNGGQYRNQVGTHQEGMIQTQSQSSLPYKVMVGGAFRPPIIGPRELLPLSRLPRIATTQTSNPGSKLLSNQITQSMQCRPDMKTIRSELLNVCTASQRSFNIETPHSRPYDVKYSIQARPIGSIGTNISTNTRDGTLKQNALPHKEIQNKTYSSVSSNAFKNVQTPITQLKGNQPITVKSNLLKGSYTTNASHAGETNSSQKYKELERNIPMGSVSTNACNTRVNLDNENVVREYTYLPSRKPRGSYSNGGAQPSFGRAEVPVQMKQNTLQERAYALSRERAYE